jgi:hypothetical protein
MIQNKSIKNVEFTFTLSMPSMRIHTAAIGAAAEK